MRNGLKNEPSEPFYVVSLLLYKKPTEVFCKKDVLRNFTKFTGKQLFQILFFNNVAVEHLWWLLLLLIKSIMK